MTLWKFSPLSTDRNPYWDNCEYKRALLVEAHDYYEAQFKATKWYQKLFPNSYHCAFNDERLYKIDRLNAEDASEEKQFYPIAQ